MAIPKKVFNCIKYATNYNNGAELKLGDKIYFIKKESDIVATLFSYADDVSTLEKQGFSTFPSVVGRRSFGSKDIALSDIPDRPEKDWSYWDEY